MQEDQCLEVGKVGKAKGFKGEVFLRITEMEVLESIDDLEGLYLRIKNKLVFYPFESYQFQNDKTIVAKFKGVNNPKFTELIKNAPLFAPLEWIPASDEETFLHEFMNAEVIDKQLGSIGKIHYIDKNSPQILAYIQHKGEEKCFPLINEFILSFEKDKQTLYIQLPEGILTIND